MKVIFRVFSYLRRYPSMAAGTLFFAVAGTLTVIVFPAVTQRIIDEVVRGHHPERLRSLVLWGAAAFLAQHLFAALRLLLNNTFEQRVIFDLRSDLYSHIQRLPLNWFDNRATGDLMTRILEDVTSVERMLIDGIEQGVIAVLQVIIVSAVMFHYSPLLAWLALAPIPLLIGGAMAYTLTAHRRYRRQRQASSAMNSLLHDNLAGIRQIKTFVRETEEHARFNQTSDDLSEATMVVMRVWAVYSPSMAFFSSCGLVLVAGFGAQAALNGSIGVGDLVAFFMLLNFLYEPIAKLHQLNQLLQSGRAAGERVFEIMDEEPEENDQLLITNDPFHFEGDVRFQNICFSYDDGMPVLKNINLHAQAGETIALVGPTGAGKSTLVNLITRFYEFDTGEIFIDGQPLRELPKDQLREAVGLVTQESFLFNGSIRDNLRLGKTGATDDEMWAALTAANAQSFVHRLPEGLGTVVGERGVKLSVGEKQRVSIARALLKDPPILILDEATASVDNQTERMIQEALDRLMQKRTSFVIAHRLSTVRHADQILVLDGGQIVERGRHEDLLKRGGIYAKLKTLTEE